MRNASFLHTQEQMRIGAAAARASADGYAGFVPGGKDVTRRMRWPWATVGMYLCAVNKGQGFKPGESAVAFGVIEIVSVRREPLNYITMDDVRREGFEMRPVDFVMMFCDHMGAQPVSEVARVEFRHVDPRRIGPAWLQLTEKQAHALGVQEK